MKLAAPRETRLWCQRGRGCRGTTLSLFTTNCMHHTTACLRSVGVAVLDVGRVGARPAGDLLAVVAAIRSGIIILLAVPTLVLVLHPRLHLAAALLQRVQLALLQHLVAVRKVFVDVTCDRLRATRSRRRHTARRRTPTHRHVLKAQPTKHIGLSTTTQSETCGLEPVASAVRDAVSPHHALLRVDAIGTHARRLAKAVVTESRATTVTRRQLAVVCAIT
jgi:hypothetical protein